MSKIQCPNCLGFTREKTFKYHKCDKSIPREITISAWAGDPLHRSDTIAFLSSLGYDSSVSHTFLVSYVSAEHQAAYLDAYSLVPPEHRQLNEHNRAQLFEASYFDDPAFRSLYKSRVFGASTCCIEVTSTPEEYGRFTLKNPVPFPVVHVKPRRQVKIPAVARPFLGAALMFFFSYFFSLVLSFILLSYFGNSHTVRWFLFKNFHIL